MILHSDILTRKDLIDMLPRQIDADIHERGSRKRARSWNVKLAYYGPKQKGRRMGFVNSGTHGAGYAYSATYDEHGEWMSRLFDIDPNAIITDYNGRDDFHRKTEYKYADLEQASKP